MKKLFLLLFLSPMLGFASLAQDSNEEYENTAHFQVDEPSIQIKTGNVVFGIGGELKVTANYDFGATLENPNDFFVQDIPMSVEPGFNNRFGMSAQQTSFNMMFKYLPGEKHQLAAYVQALLLGDDYLPSLDYAFLTYRGILAGYNYTIFSDQNAVPATIDHEGPLAYTGVQKVVFDVAGAWGKHWSAGIGLEMNKPGHDFAYPFAEAGQRIPDVPAFVQFRVDEGSWLRLSAIARNMFYYAELPGKTKDTFGYGFQFSGGLEIVPGVQALWQATAGKGITTYYQDFNDTFIQDLVPNVNGKRLNDMGSWGGFLGFAFQLNEKLTANVMYSHLRLYPGSKGVVGEEDFKYGQNAIANIFYDINDHFQWGLEYIWGRRVNMDGLHNHNNRIQTSLAFSF